MRQEGATGSSYPRLASDGGLTYVKVIGINPDVDSGTLPEDVWTGAAVTPLYPFPAAAAATEIVSDAAADAFPAGTGARTVFVQGLDAAGLPLEETVALAGVAPVGLVGVYFRINHVRVVTAGSVRGNVGNVSVRHPGPVTIAHVRAPAIAGQPGDGAALQAIYTVPANAIAPRLIGARANVGHESAGAFMELRILSRRLAAPDQAIVTRDHLDLTTSATNIATLVYPLPIPLVPFQDIWWRALATDVNNLEPSCELDLLFSLAAP